jgi:hypothetical protein
MRYLHILITLAMVAVSNYTYAQGCGQPVPIPPGSCGTAGQELVFETLDWSNPPSTTTTFNQGTDISSSKFRTTTSTSYSGGVVLAHTPGASATHNIWISQCPGGPQLVQERDSCRKSGSGETIVLWTQGAAKARSCNLELDTDYYINYQATDCSGSACKFIRQFY